MKKNMGNTDKIVRVLMAIAIGYFIYNGNIAGIVAMVAAALAIIFLLTSVLGLCPLYVPFGIRTNCCGHCESDKK